MTRPSLEEALQNILMRPVTEAEVSRARGVTKAAAQLLQDKVGPVPPGVYPPPAVDVTLARMAARVIEGGALEVTDDDLRLMAANAAKYRPPHPFNLA